MTEANESPTLREINTVAMSAEINKLAEALSKAQVEIHGAVKTSENPYFKSRYADLATVWDACREPLSKQGLAVIQTTDGSPEQVVILTTLAHSSGQWIRGRLVMKPIKPDPQGIGSCLTYGRRYALAAIVGVAPEDDDGNAASGKHSGKASETPVERHLPNFEQAKREGRITPATPAPVLRPEVQGKPAQEEIPKQIKTLMELSGVGLDELKAYLETREFIPKGGRVIDMKPNISAKIVEDGNWATVVSRIKAARPNKAA